MWLAYNRGETWGGTMAEQRIKPGYGYWDVTSYPLGGCFCRAGDGDVVQGTGVVLVSVEPTKLGRNNYGVDSVGTTTDGRRVAFHSSHTELNHWRRPAYYPPNEDNGGNPGGL
jgi:hypothetical protein